jgi:membrane-bound ClpP family serine protease
MIRIVLWLLTASTRYSYLFMRALLRLPLLVLPIPRRTRNQVAGALAVGLWFLGVCVLVVAAESPWWGLLIVGVIAALVIGWTVRMESRRVLVPR